MKKRTEHYVGFQSRDQEDVASAVINYPNSRSSNLYISSDDKTDGSYANALYQNNSKLIKRQTSQIGLKRYNIFYCIPNINENNNSITVIIDGAPETSHTTSILLKNYETIVELYDEITSQLSAISGETFNYLVEDCVVTLACSKPFRFGECSFINNGSSVHGLFYTGSSNVDSMKAAPQLIYTRYIDVLITDIKDAEIGQSTFTEIKRFSKIDHLSRIFLKNNIIPQYIDEEFDNIDYFPYRHRSLTTFQITLYDEYQNVIFSKVQTLDGSLYEIKLLKYEFVLNIIS